MVARRAIWIVNHQTLLAAEVPILRSLGYEVFIPKIVPKALDFRSAVVEHRYDDGLGFSPAALRVLNDHPFYERIWSPTLTNLLNDEFDVLITSVSAFTTPLFEALRKFRGPIVARVFGREIPRRYSEFFDGPSGSPLVEAVHAAGGRFVFGQAFDNLAEIESDFLRSRARTLTVAVPDSIWARQDSWHGAEATCLFLCPNIRNSVYYGAVYETIKTSFGELPHALFGRQHLPPDDAAVLPYMTDVELLALYARMRVFVYPSSEPRHLHYSPIEAMIIGAPVLFMRGGMLDRLGTSPQAGVCEDLADMKAKAARLLAGEDSLTWKIRRDQRAIVTRFASDIAHRQWRDVLAGADVPGVCRERKLELALP